VININILNLIWNSSNADVRFSQLFHTRYQLDDITLYDKQYVISYNKGDLIVTSFYEIAYRLMLTGTI
jgi:hypothetical protein